MYNCIKIIEAITIFILAMFMVFVNGCASHEVDVEAPFEETVQIVETKKIEELSAVDKRDLLLNMSEDKKKEELKKLNNAEKEKIVDEFISRCPSSSIDTVNGILKNQTKSEFFDQYIDEIAYVLEDLYINEKYYEAYFKNIDYNLLSLRQIFNELLENVRGDAANGYRQNLYEVQTNGYIYDYATMEKHEMNEEDYLKMSIEEIRRIFLSADEQFGED